MFLKRTLHAYRQQESNQRKHDQDRHEARCRPHCDGSLLLIKLLRREFQARVKKVDLIPPHQVKPFVVGNKNDANDAVAIGEASYRPKAVFVPVKSISQQDIQSLHRIRERAVKTRTAVANQMRGLLSEYGIILPKKMSVLRKEVPFVLEDAEQPLSTTARSFIADLYDELIVHDKQIKRQELALKALLINDDNYQRICQTPGIGPQVVRTAGWAV